MVKLQTRKYTEEFKGEAVQLVLKLPSVGEASRQLGIPSSTLQCTWLL